MERNGNPTSTVVGSWQIIALPMKADLKCYFILHLIFSPLNRNPNNVAFHLLISVIKCGGRKAIAFEDDLFSVLII